jgi:hypothetical protein
MGKIFIAIELVYAQKNASTVDKMKIMKIKFRWS